MAKRLNVLLGAGLCALAFAGCAPANDAPPPGVEQTDVMFLQMMIPHHNQGVTLVRLARDRSAREDVKMLAAAIETTQISEIQTMAGWLRSWNKPPVAPPHAHDSHGGMPETSPDEVAALEKATGADFDRRFLNTMIAHQDDAVQIARMEVARGAFTAAKELATRIDRSRSAEIQQMLGYLGANR
ncbi:DUF305 domain-containing protein [Amycolatopsis anabasis]|uniref:DUF305 domain-containing protein n=1 Tax=Amycolatopsis anabasis TaxID=1840409 RepID=UPI00131DF094|nr:DUF305 domain-containing protein [Amycolatopsis anabasis]